MVGMPKHTFSHLSISFVISDWTTSLSQQLNFGFKAEKTYLQCIKNSEYWNLNKAYSTHYQPLYQFFSSSKG